MPPLHPPHPLPTDPLPPEEPNGPLPSHKQQLEALASTGKDSPIMHLTLASHLVACLCTLLNLRAAIMRRD